MLVPRSVYGKVIWSFGRAVIAQRFRNAALGLICAFLAWPRCKRLRCAVQPALPGLRQALLRPVFVAVALMSLAVSGFAAAQVSKEYQVKAVFLSRLAQFTQWQSGAFETGESPIVICVFGENPFNGALHAAVEGETTHRRRLVIQDLRNPGQLKACHIVFVASVGPRQANEIGAALAGRSVLAVGEADGVDSSYDPMVRFITAQNKIKLGINHGAWRQRAWFSTRASSEPPRLSTKVSDDRASLN